MLIRTPLTSGISTRIGISLAPYWHYYVLDPDSEHVADVVHHTIRAVRHDLLRMLERTDVLSLTRDTMSACTALRDVDVDFDVVLMVGVGARTRASS